MLAAAIFCSAFAQQDFKVADELSSYDVKFYQAASDYGSVNVHEARHLAHKLWLKADFPEDWRDHHYTNGISVWPSFLGCHYRGRVSLTFDRATGRMFAFGIACPNENLAPNLAADECVAKAVEYYHFVGGRHELALIRLATEKDPQKVHPMFAFVAPGSDYRFSAGVEAIMDRTYGTPDNMWIGVPPEFDRPARVVPKEEASANAAAAVLHATGWSVVETGVQDASYAIPEYRTMPNRMNATHVRRAKEKRACLVYEATVSDASLPEEAGKLRPFVQVYVDAETGEPIALFPAFERMGGQPYRRQPFVWGTGMWLSGGGRGAVESSKAEPPFATRCVVLRQGRTTVWANYDSRSGLLWLVSAGKAVVGKPDAALRRGLAQAKPPQAFPMRRVPATTKA